MRLLGAYSYLDNNQNTNPYDGICGMSISKLSSTESEDLIFDALYRANLIDSRMFSFYLNVQSKDSYIFFGGYEEDKIPNLLWVDLKGSNPKHWNVVFRNCFVKDHY